jgi:hypothetical protein
MTADSPAASTPGGGTSVAHLLHLKPRLGRRRVSVVAVSVVALAVGIAGCGGSSKSSSGMTPASYRATVNNMCATANAEVTALPASTNESVAGLNKILVIAKTELARIKAIAPPSSMSAGVSKWVGADEQEAADVDQILGALKAGNTSQARSLDAKATQLDSQTNAQAKSLGLPGCAANPQPSASG